jgi:tripartite-type tricarboxylate transporter receptor subunit TctC
LQDLAAGRIDFFFDSPIQLPHVRAGGIKAYGVTSNARLAQAPDIPTLSEMGLPSVSVSTWQALFAPKNVPKEIIGKLNAAAVEALADATVPMVKADAEKWWPIIKDLGIKPRPASGFPTRP